MRYYSYNDPVFDEHGTHIDDTVVTVSEEEIRREYYPTWQEQLLKAVQSPNTRIYGRDPNDFGFEECLDEWVVVNWAWEVRDEESV